MMFRNYILLAIRNIRKRPVNGLINVLGLGIGLAASLLIFLYAQHELSYDRFHERADRIHQVYKERITPTGTQITRDTWAPLGERMATTFPSVEAATRIFSRTRWVDVGAERFQEDVTFADPELFDVFTFPLERGDAGQALAAPDGVVLSADAADRFFGGGDVLGRTIQIDTLVYRVTGILAPIPTNSTIAPEIIVPITTHPTYAEWADDWGSSFLYTYVLLDPNAPADRLEAQFSAFVVDLFDEETAARTNFRLEALPDLYDALTDNRQTAFILLGIALAILLIASINFTNLSTARAGERAREIGMRKVLGADRGQLVRQFLGESIVLTFLALLVGIGLTEMALPAFRELYEIRIGLHYTDLRMLGALLGLGLTVGLLAGSYPAVALSRFRPIRTLGGQAVRGPGGARLRKALVVTQFALSVILIVGTLVVRAQLDFMQHADLNFDRAQVVTVPVEAADFADPEAAATRLATFKQELARSPRIEAVSSSSHIPGDWSGWNMFVRPEGWTEDAPLRMRYAVVDDRYFDVMGIPLLEGRSFDPERESDRTGVILNRAALRAFGWETADGKTIRLGTQGEDAWPIVGVAEDYHLESMREEITPILHFYRPPENSNHQYVTARLAPGDPSAALAFMQAQWSMLDPTREMPFSFADERFALLYRNEQRMGVVASAFTLLGILVACLGLFGLASWATLQRVKEIGIRKVLGASVGDLVLLLSKDFLTLVGIALVLGGPAAYVIMRWWLTDFAYAVPLGPGIFLAAAALTLLIAALTVGVRALRTATADPVHALRYE